MIKLYIPKAFRFGIEYYLIMDKDLVDVDIQELTLCWEAQFLNAL